jgi:hypothetical protein
MDTQYFHEGLDRRRAVTLLRTRGCRGSYLIRDSSTVPNSFVLSFRVDPFVRHFTILKQACTHLWSPLAFRELSVEGGDAVELAVNSYSAIAAGWRAVRHRLSVVCEHSRADLYVQPSSIV